MAQFLQSVRDFPCAVTLGNKSPAWGLSRWGGASLRFHPPDDEGFTLRGDKQRRLVYQGRRRSHRFTVLGDTAFEYDCILLREPETNVIVLRMEGAEHFDFFRQPDFIPDPFLAGSYAVYKKETLIGEGTGKLCHIHRPEIIDAGGRRCWGVLSIAGDRLCIIIPEAWLADARYPVVVDPTIGTTTVGSQYLWDNGEESLPLSFEYMLGVNRFLISDTINGTCTAYIYVNADEEEAAGRPVLYSDNNNIPQTRRSKNEDLINFRVNGSTPKGWRTGTFQSNGAITSGSYIWFGVCAEYFWFPRFDYGAKCYRDWWDSYDSVPDTYPLADANEYYNFKLSMYFTYSGQAQSFTRTLTQGVALVDGLKPGAGYKRSSVETAGSTGTAQGIVGVFRRIAETVTGVMALVGSPLLKRSLVQQVGVGHGGITRNVGFNRLVTDTAGNGAGANGFFIFFRMIFDLVRSGDSTGSFITRIGIIRDTESARDDMGHTADYLRGLIVEAVSIAETRHKGEYYRFQHDIAYSGAVPLRFLFIFLRLVTGAFIRDYILNRFLVSKEEMVLKSAVCREITIESSLH